MEAVGGVGPAAATRLKCWTRLGLVAAAEALGDAQPALAALAEVPAEAALAYLRFVAPSQLRCPVSCSEMVEPVGVVGQADSASREDSEAWAAMAQRFPMVANKPKPAAMAVAVATEARAVVVAAVRVGTASASSPKAQALTPIKERTTSAEARLGHAVKVATLRPPLG